MQVQVQVYFTRRILPVGPLLAPNTVFIIDIMGKVRKVSSFRQRRSQEEMAIRRSVPRRGATRYCVYGNCKSDSRNADETYMMGVTWMPFPKPHLQFDKCMNWIRACGRDDFQKDNVKKWTYICSKHFVGENGPTEKHPDPIPAAYNARQVWRCINKVCCNFSCAFSLSLFIYIECIPLILLTFAIN